MANVKTTLYLPAALQVRYRELSRRSGRSQAELMREALERYAESQPRPSLEGFIGMAEDHLIPGFDSSHTDAYLEEHWGRERA